ncbi:hypothetical protein AWB76_00948 [Caballeronia temeraria]|uniref:Trimeric autotransporter adhesin YadA-like stalk domain-containing protein n=1 Tax=Caballeronia temeraria TaxID=1777137 RepID=A0A157ZM93_9BURK|nr:hypothetical protein [Caballeronia temeraria]SAK46640.1 hypothetical protein AWB76_00948 [Caballeronia temeraria]
MSVPQSITALSQTLASNSPPGNEPIGNNLALYLQAGFGFIAQLRDGTALNMTKALSMNNYQINNVAAGTAANDAVNLNQLKTYEPIGTIKMWWGTATNAAVQAAWGTNWALCNGANGTPNFLDRMPIAAGGSYATGSAGGTTTYALSVANMPAHSHYVNDPGHAHGVYDPQHAHGVSDPGHAHGMPNGGVGQAGSDNGGVTAASGPNGYGSRGAQSTYGSGTGIGIYGAGTGIGIYGSGTGIWLNNTGSGAAFTVIPPYIGVCFVMKIAN